MPIFLQIKNAKNISTWKSCIFRLLGKGFEGMDDFHPTGPCDPQRAHTVACSSGTCRGEHTASPEMGSWPRPLNLEEMGFAHLSVISLQALLESWNTGSLQFSY